ncbi:MAG: hypothetical protein VX498_01260 [Myxococcota bacterium]|nr:hypothetical protein [Myxococcota bacterium]
MLEWKRNKAVRRLAWGAIVFAIFPGLFFVILYSWSTGWSPEALLSLYPATLLGGIALALHRLKPSSPVAMEEWCPERELITPLPRSVETRWSTPRATLPILLWIIPGFYLAGVAWGVRDLNGGALALLSIIPAVFTVRALVSRERAERFLLREGVVARGRIRHILSGGGQFRMKVEYDYEGERYQHWTPNLSAKTWFGLFLVEERRYVTLLLDRESPKSFVVYRFCSHEVLGSERRKAS